MTRPVIILGAARSGTKYLRDILATAPNAVKVPYDINYIWRYRSESHPDDALPASLITERKRAFIAAQVHRLAGATESSDAVLLEKTVGNTLRVEFVDAVFPQAKFVHLVRDGRAVAESAMRQWTEPLDKGRLLEKLKGVPLQNLGYVAWFGSNVLKGMLAGRGGGHVWGPRYPGIADDLGQGRPLSEICARQWRSSVDLALEGLSRIAPERQITLRYDELVAGEGGLRRVAEFCELENIDGIVAAHAQRVDTRADDKWRTALDTDNLARIDRIVRPSLERLGYVSEGAIA